MSLRVTTKKCSKCGSNGPFYKDLKRPDGLANQCKACESAYRKGRYSKLKRDPLETPPTPPEAEYLPAPATAPDPLEAAHRHFADSRAKRDIKAEHGALLEENRRLKALMAEVEAMGGEPRPVVPSVSIEPVKGEAVPLVVLSDWHVEEKVELAKMHGLNEYNLDICRERSAHVFTNTLRLVEMCARESVIRRMVVALGGDFISNSIHDELMEINQLGPGYAAQFAKDLLQGGIEYWLANTDLDFTFVCVSGNHGRMTEKTRISTNAENSLEIFMYKFLAAEFKHEPRVRFEIGAAGNMAYHDIFPNFKLRVIHGDQVSYGGGVGGLTIPMNKWISRQNQAINAQLTVAGHFHQRFDGGSFLVNSSLIGASPYSQWFGFSPEPPSQQFALIHAKHGKALVAPIWAD